MLLDEPQKPARTTYIPSSLVSKCAANVVGPLECKANKFQTLSVQTTCWIESHLLEGPIDSMRNNILAKSQQKPKTNNKNCKTRTAEDTFVPKSKTRKIVGLFSENRNLHIPSHWATLNSWRNRKCWLYIGITVVIIAMIKEKRNSIYLLIISDGTPSIWYVEIITSSDFDCPDSWTKYAAAKDKINKDKRIIDEKIQIIGIPQYTWCDVMWSGFVWVVLSVKKQRNECCQKLFKPPLRKYGVSTWYSCPY